VRLGAVETGGTKVVCLVGSGPDHIVAQTAIPTGEPVETLAQVLVFFQQEVASGGPLAAIGIASFGPLELRRSHPRYGFITTSPKPGWSYVDLVGPIRNTLGVPVGFDTDVNAAALSEGRWGSARGLDTFLYLTAGTGIGAGAVINGEVIHGLGHPEMGHVSVSHQPGDDFAGTCPFTATAWRGWPVAQRSPPAGVARPSNSTVKRSWPPPGSRPPILPLVSATSSTSPHHSGS
jgi:fructokinase